MTLPREYALKRMNLDGRLQDQIDAGDLVAEEVYNHKKLYGVVESVRPTEILIRKVNGLLHYEELNSGWTNNHFFINLQKQTLLVKYGTNTWIDFSWCDERDTIPQKDINVFVV